MRRIQALLVAVFGALLGACASAPDEPYYQASTAQPFAVTPQSGIGKSNGLGLVASWAS